MTPHLFWIPGPWRGKLTVMTRPRGGDWLHDELRGWRRAGVDVVVCLLESHEAALLDLADESKLAATNGIQFISFPIADRGVPNSFQASLALFASVTNALDEGRTVAIHCRQGIGRSGLVAAGILATSGVQPEQSIKIVSAARGLAVPETDAQVLWIKQLPSQAAVATR